MDIISTAKVNTKDLFKYSDFTILFYRYIILIKDYARKDYER